MPQLDPTTWIAQLFWLIVTFVALYFVLSRSILPRIANVMEARQSKIDDDLDRAAASKQEADGVLAEYEKALAEGSAGVASASPATACRRDRFDSRLARNGFVSMSATLSGARVRRQAAGARQVQAYGERFTPGEVGRKLTVCVPSVGARQSQWPHDRLPLTVSSRALVTYGTTPYSDAPAGTRTQDPRLRRPPRPFSGESPAHTHLDLVLRHRVESGWCAAKAGAWSHRSSE